MDNNIETYFPRKNGMQGFGIILKVILLGCLVLFSNSCKGNMIPGTRYMVPTISSTSIVTQKTTLTLTPEQFSTPTKIFLTKTPLGAIDTASIGSAEPTWTSTPTLLPATRHQNLLELLLTNGGCDYPCWWGVRQGVTAKDIYVLHSLLGEYPERYDSIYTYSLSFDELNFSDLLVEFYVEKETVQRIDVNLMKPSRLTNSIEILNNAFSISNISMKYGKPSEVILQVKPRSEKDAPIAYSLLILYMDKGFAIQYDGLVNAEEPITICPYINDYHLENVSIFLQNSQAMIDLKAISQENHYLPIDSVTAMKLEEFFQVYSSDNERSCFETSLNLWQ